jgi:hypothetical protein
MCAWLLGRAASHVEQLEISYESEGQEDEVVAAAAAVMGELAAAAALCGTTGQPLTHLALSVSSMPLSIGSWSLPLRGSLRRLQLAIIREEDDDPDYPLSLATLLPAFTALEALSADTQTAGWLALEPHILPSSLTALHLGELRASTAIAMKQVGAAALQCWIALSASGRVLTRHQPRAALTAECGSSSWRVPACKAVHHCI